MEFRASRQIPTWLLAVYDTTVMHDMQRNVYIRTVYKYYEFLEPAVDC